MRKFISIKYIVESLFRDLDLQQEPNWLDWVEWSAEALEAIGADIQYVIKSTDGCDLPALVVSCHKAELPLDFHSIIDPVIFNGAVLMSQDHAKIYASGNTVDQTATVLNEEVAPERFPRLVTYNSVKPIEYYTIQDNCFITSIRDGEFNINYWSIPLDDDGFPMIPDEFFYREAIKAYIIYRHYYPKWIVGTINNAVFKEMKDRWAYFSVAAGNKAAMPDLSEMERIKRQWVRLYPNMNVFNNGFRDLGDQQNITHH